MWVLLPSPPQAELYSAPAAEEAGAMSARPRPWLPLGAETLLLLLLGLFLADIQGDSVPDLPQRQVEGIVGGSVSLSVLIPPEEAMDNIEWTFHPENSSILAIAEFTVKKWEWIPPGVQFQQRLEKANETTLRIKDLAKEDSGVYMAYMRFKSTEVRKQTFLLHVYEVVPVGIIAGATIGAGILVIFCFIALACFLYRRRKGSRKDVTLRKLDIKVETVNREPPTLHMDCEEDTASVSTATRVMKAIYSLFKDDVDLKQDLRSDTIDTREEYELKDPTNGDYNVRAHADYRNPGPTHCEAHSSSHPSSGYIQLNTYDQGPTSEYSSDPVPGPTAGPATAETASQLSCETYGGHTAFPPNAGYATYHLDYTQPPPPALDRATYDPLGKYTTTTHFSYTSSDYGQRFQQQMQTHV